MKEKNNFIHESFLEYKIVCELNKIIENSERGYLSINNDNVVSFIISKDSIILKKIFTNSSLHEIIKRDNLIIENLFLVDQKIISIDDSSMKNVPYTRHKDVHRREKIFIYLSECEINDGPLNLQCDPKKEDLVPMIGNKGDMIYFNTDMNHAAGIPKLHSKRRVIRLDCYKKDEIRKNDFILHKRYNIKRYFQFKFFSKKINKYLKNRNL